MKRIIFSVAFFMLAACCVGLYGQDQPACAKMVKSSLCASKMQVQAAANTVEAVQQTKTVAQTPTKCQSLKSGTAKVQLVSHTKTAGMANCDPADCDPAQCRPVDCDPSKCDRSKCTGRSASTGTETNPTDCIPSQCKSGKVRLAVNSKL